MKTININPQKIAANLIRIISSTGELGILKSVYYIQFLIGKNNFFHCCLVSHCSPEKEAAWQVLSIIVLTVITLLAWEVRINIYY